MMRSRLVSIFGVLAAAVVLSGAASAGARTYVSLAGRDDAIPKLGRPGIAVSVEASTAGAKTAVADELERELTRLVHTRRLAAGEAGDYDLDVKVEEPRADGAGETIRFEARLKAAGGDSLWQVEGRTDLDGAPVDAAAFAGISRNVVSALLHDGWVQPRYDPDDPPPQAPRLRTEGGAR